MSQQKTLAEYLAMSCEGSENQSDLADTILHLAQAAKRVSALIQTGSIEEKLAEIVGDNSDGDEQKALDIRAHDLIIENLKETAVAILGSEEADDAIVLNEEGSLVVTTDPLDGSSNIANNVTIGTIFSIYPRRANCPNTPNLELLQKGTQQLAAGFFCYGPQTNLVLSVGKGTHVFTLHPETKIFVQTIEGLTLPNDPKKEFAINASNYRYWDSAIRAYVDDCLAGATGPRALNYNMRWVASLVAETFRIMSHGGIFLYPRDARRNYNKGRLRLVYEANPIAFLLEQSGGAATDAVRRILEIQPEQIHQRVPLVFGCKEEVLRVANLYTAPMEFEVSAPLFQNRGLFRS